jgi:hypothetical protein
MLGFIQQASRATLGADKAMTKPGSWPVSGSSTSPRMSRSMRDAEPTLTHALAGTEATPSAWPSEKLMRKVRYRGGALWARHKNGHALARSQSRVTARGEIFKAAAISSSVNPPKYRSSTTFACGAATREKAVKTPSRAKMDRSGAALAPVRSELFTPCVVY